VSSSQSDPTPGWWEGMVGPDKAIDTNRYRVICASILGSPFGTTSPLSINPETGKHYGPSFPPITTKDQAACHYKLLQHLGTHVFQFQLLV
jgi:homoserine O-acetyltransferase